MTEHFKHRRRQLHDEGDGAQQTQTQDQRHADTNPPRLGSVLLRQFVGEDRNKDQVIDTEHDLHHDQGGQGDPGGGAGGKL
ncbi:hypothetical protein D3C85_1791420 [compost metagenome]